MKTITVKSSNDRNRCTAIINSKNSPTGRSIILIRSYEQGIGVQAENEKGEMENLGWKPITNGHITVRINGQDYLINGIELLRPEPPMKPQ